MEHPLIGRVVPAVVEPASTAEGESAGPTGMYHEIDVARLN